MDDFVAHPSPWRAALLSLGCVAFVVIGLWLAGLFGPIPASNRYSPALTLVAGWCSVVFFGLCGMMWVRAIFRKKDVLRIGSAGVRSTQWSGQTIPWSEIVDVTTWSYQGQMSIVLHLKDRTRFPGRGLAAMLAGANRQLTGGDIFISLTGTDRRTEDALCAIERFRPHAT